MKTKLFTLLFAIVASINTIWAYVVVGDLNYEVYHSNYTAILVVGRSTYTLKNVNIPSTINYMGGVYTVVGIDNSAFENSTKLQSITIPSTVTSIGFNAFKNCSNLNSVTILSSDVTIGAYAFDGCTSLPTIDNLRYVSTYLVGVADKTLSSYTIQEGTKVIIPFAFESCLNMTSITIPYGVKSVGENAFYGCNHLTSMTIPSSVTEMGLSAFQTGYNIMTAIYYESNTPIAISNTLFDSNVVIYIPNCAYTAFSSAPVWKDLTIVPVDVNLTVVNNVGGLVNETCGSMEIEAIPYIGYHFKRWQDGNTDNPRKYTLTQSNRNFIAEFEINKYQITLSCDANQGSIIGDKGKFNFDTEHEIEAVPNYGYHFAQWNDGMTENPRTFTLEQDTTFTALFAKNTYSITTNSASPEWATTTGDASQLYLEEVEIAANSIYGYHFTQWNDGNTDNPRTIIVTRDSLFTAEFAVDTFSVSALSANDIQGSVTGSGFYTFGELVTLTAIPNEGYRFEAWNDGNTDNPREISLTKDTVLMAYWVKCPTEVKESNITICAGNSYNWMDGDRLIGTYEQSGIYVDTLRYYDAPCDSIIFTLNLTVQQPTDMPAESAIICAGETYNWQGKQLTESGIYYDTLRYTTGCDSVRFTLNLTVQQSTDMPAESAIICAGETYNWQGKQLTESGIYYDTLRYTTGCDSVRFTLNLTVQQPTDMPAESAIICAGETYNWQGKQLTESGIYYDTLRYTTGCDSVRFTLNLSVQDVTVEQLDTDTITLDIAAEYGFDEIGNYTWNDTLRYTTGCDSVILQHALVVLPIPNFTITVTSNNLSYGTVIGSGVFPKDSIVYIEALANTNCQFIQWSDGNTDNPREIMVQNDAEYVAVFDIQKYLWQVESNDVVMGTIVTNYTAPAYYYGTSIEAEAVPNSGYKFVKWNNGQTYNPYRFALIEDTYLRAIFMVKEATPEETEVQPTTTAATFTWPLVIGGYTYTLTVYLDVEKTNPFCDIFFDQFGHFINRIFHAPARHHMQEEEAFTYTITDLTPLTQYYYEMKAYNQEEKLLNTDLGSFCTTNDATGIEDQPSNIVTPSKFMYEGQIYIRRGDKIYSIQGQEVK